MILSFKEQFKDPILKGTKLHTIREDKTNRWKPGNKIEMATGVRTKNYNCFKKSVCVSTQTIEIKHGRIYDVNSGDFLLGIRILIDGKELDSLKINGLAKNDGFVDIIHFANWFNTDFYGKIIHWTHLKY